VVGSVLFVVVVGSHVVVVVDRVDDDCDDVIDDVSGSDEVEVVDVDNVGLVV